MSAEITAVAFDLGGVLIDWNPRHLYRQLFGGDDEAMERFLTEVCPLEWNRTLDAGAPFAETIATRAAAFPEHAELIHAYHVRWTEMLGGQFDDTLEILRELKAAGLPVYALSNWAAETWAGTRERFPFLDEFDGILISGEAGVAKPDPAIFREFLRRFNLDPAKTVYIDDWDFNIEAGKAAGLQAIQFFDADRLRVDLRALGLPLAERSARA